MTEQRANDKSDSRPRFQFGLRTVLVAFLVIGIVLGCLAALRNAIREDPREVMALSLRRALLALANFSSAHGHLPPAVWVDDSGQQLSSWRYLLLPYLCTADPWNFQVPWNSPTAKRFERWGVFYCHSPGGDPTETNIMAITGPDTGFDDQNPHAIEDLPGDLILLAEIRRSGIHWMAPGDLDIRTMPRTIGQANGISGITRGVFHVGFADLSVWRLSPNTPLSELEKFFTITGATTNDRDEILGPYCLDRR